MIIEYLIKSFFWRGRAEREFFKQGLGIARRRRQFGACWKPHLEHCKQVQAEWCDELSKRGEECLPKELVVLGAGRCFDLNAKALSRHFSKMRLIDADASCKRIWKKLASALSSSQIEGEVREVTGLVQRWMRLFQDQLKLMEAKGQRAKWISALQILSRISVQEQNERSPDKLFTAAQAPFALLSLNMLSQIPVIWQNIVKAELTKHFSKKWVEQNKEKWLQAFDESAKLVINRHLSDLGSSGATEILLITDLEYGYYADKAAVSSDESFNCIITKDAEERAEDDWRHCFGENSPAEVYESLYGIDLEHRDTRRELFPRYDSRHLGTWFWHIAPLGGEEQHRGSIHRVGAFSFQRKSTAAP